MNTFANAYLSALNPRATATRHPIAGHDPIAGIALGGISLSLAEGTYKLVSTAQALVERTVREITSARNKLAQPARREQNCPSG